MKKQFIFSISDGIKVIIDSDNLAEAQQEYEKIKEEASSLRIRAIKVPKKKPIRMGIYEHILELKDGGFFSQPKSIGEIRDKLAEFAVNKPITSFPPYLNSLIKERILKRTKQNRDGKWIWVYEDGHA